MGGERAQGPVQPDETETKDLLFAQVFGISKDELRSRGIDPDRYLHDHIGEAIDNEGTARLLLPESTILFRNSIRHGSRFYTALFVGLGALLISTVHVQAGHVVGLAAALIVWLMAVREIVLQMRLYGAYKAACRVEGEQPKTLWGRRAPLWRIGTKVRPE